MTSFIGTTWKQRQKFLAQEENEIAQLKTITDRIDERMNRRKLHIDNLRREIQHLEKKNLREWYIWHEGMNRQIARNKHICAMFDELKAHEEQQNG